MCAHGRSRTRVHGSEGRFFPTYADPGKYAMLFELLKAERLHFALPDRLEARPFEPQVEPPMPAKNDATAGGVGWVRRSEIMRLDLSSRTSADYDNVVCSCDMAYPRERRRLRACLKIRAEY